jgi:hypothetical protein
MSFTDMFSIQESYPTDKTFTDGGITVAGTYVTHNTTFKPNGMWEGTETTCATTPEVCFSRTNFVDHVEFDFNVPLIGDPLPNNTIIHVWRSQPDPLNDSTIVDEIIDTYFHVNP